MGTGQAQLGGTVTLAGGGVLTSRDQTAGIGLSGVLTASGNAQIDGVFTNTGTVNGPTGGGELLTFTDDVSGAGNYTGKVLFSDGFSPGASPAIVSLENMTFDGTTALTMELGGTTPGTQHDHLNISGTATLDGTLDVLLINGFDPQAGNTFDLFDFGNLSGTFDTVNLPELDPGLLWNTANLYITGELSVSEATAPVPESSTWLLLASGLAGLAAWARRRRAR